MCSRVSVLFVQEYKAGLKSLLAGRSQFPLIFRDDMKQSRLKSLDYSGTDSDNCSC